MGRKDGRLPQPLELKVPSLFRCPISLEVMRSPVSLCTGVTYDRVSIQRWLDSGNTTCPATMQPLPSTDLVPNLTLRRLIHHWSSAAPIRTLSTSAAASPHDLLRDLHSADPLPPLRRLADFFDDPNIEDFQKDGLFAGHGCVPILVSLLHRESTLHEAVRALAAIFGSESVEDGNKEMLVASMTSSSNLDPTISSLVAALKNGSIETRVNAGTVLDFILVSRSSDSECKTMIADKPDLLQELVRLIGPAGDGGSLDRGAIDVGLACLVGLLGARRMRARIVQLGIVPALARVLAADAKLVPPAAAERALRLMECAAGCAEGRAAISEGAAEVMGAVVGRMMKVGRAGREAAAVVLWSVCHLFRDRRAQEAVAAAEGGLTKILLLMQSDCSPAVRQMAGDLLRIFRVNSKSCLAGYDTNNTHIMPF